MRNEPPPEDELLVIRCRHGDARALDELLGRWQERLWHYAWRQTKDEAAAWDILQETFLAIARDIGKLELSAAFGAWAYRIASHKARDWMRQGERRRRREHDFAESWQIENASAAPAWSDLDRLKEALEGLSPNERSLLTLRYEDDLDLGEIAQVLGVPVGTVKSRLHHTRERLRNVMENEP